jgi:membrane protein
VTEIWRRLGQRLFRAEAAPASRRTTLGVRTLRVAYRVAEDLLDGRITLHAMSLVYTTLLSLVPLLAFSFSVLKALGVHNEIEPLLANVLSPLGERGAELSDRIVQFVGNVRVGALGSLGLALLVYTVISLLNKVEDAFNFIWHVERSRSFAQRFSQYLSVVLVGPLLVFAALGITGSLMSSAVVHWLGQVEPVGRALDALVRLLPYLLVIAAFSFAYVFMPNTRVWLSAALLGGAVAGTLWETVGWGFAVFIVKSATYTAIYSSFAIIILFMIWLYLSWLILLIGASLAFYVQHPEYVWPASPEAPADPPERERAGLLVLYLIGERFYRGGRPWNLSALARRLGRPQAVVQRIVAPLCARGILLQTSDADPVYLPARDPQTVPFRDLWTAVRGAPGSATARLPAVPVVERVLGRIEQATVEALQDWSWKALVDSDASGPAQIAPSL